MASIPEIPGISYARYRGGWKLRWRETHATPDGLTTKARSYTVPTEAQVPRWRWPSGGRWTTRAGGTRPR